LTTLNLQVSASTDDAREDGDGVVWVDYQAVKLLGSLNWGGFRWDGITIPNGATINAADFQVYLYDSGYDDIEVDIYGEDGNDPGTFTSSNSDISDRTLTSASVNESASDVGTGWYSMPDVASIVQEIVDTYGGLSNEALVLIEDALAGVSLWQRTYDGDTALAAKLDIDYTALIAGPLVGRVPVGSLVHGGLV
jgi:hypothetical protein